MKPIGVALPERDCGLAEVSTPLELDVLVPGSGPWEVEIGFGKGRYLLRRAQEEPRARFLGIEVASQYARILTTRARRRSVDNLLVLRGEALALLGAVLPRGFARAVHVYFPDPWPKSRHRRRRLFDPESVDLVLGLLAPGGCLAFATDFLEYGDQVEGLLRDYPGLAVERRGAWPDGARTNYEAKYLAEGRPILRLEAYPQPDLAPLHTGGRPGILAAYYRRPDPTEESVPRP